MRRSSRRKSGVRSPAAVRAACRVVVLVGMGGCREAAWAGRPGEAGWALGDDGELDKRKPSREMGGEGAEAVWGDGVQSVDEV